MSDAVTGFYASLDLKSNPESFNNAQKALDGIKNSLIELGKVSQLAGSSFNDFSKSMALASRRLGSEKFNIGLDNLKKYQETLKNISDTEVQSVDVNVPKKALKTDQKDAEESQNDRLKKQKGLITDIGSGLKSVLGAALAVKAAYSTASGLFDSAKEGMTSAASGSLLGLKATDILALGNAFSLMTKNVDGAFDAMYQMQMLLPKLQLTNEGQEKLKNLGIALAAGGIKLEDFLAMDAKTQMKTLLSVSEKVNQDKSDPLRLFKMAAIDAVNPSINPMAAAAATRGGVSKVFGEGQRIQIVSEGNVKELNELDAAFTKANAVLKSSWMRFSAAIGDAGLTGALNGFTDWIVANQPMLTAITKGFIDSIGAIFGLLGIIWKGINIPGATITGALKGLESESGKMDLTRKMAIESLTKTKYNSQSDAEAAIKQYINPDQPKNVTKDFLDNLNSKREAFNKALKDFSGMAEIEYNKKNPGSSNNDFFGGIQESWKNLFHLQSYAIPNQQSQGTNNNLKLDITIRDSKGYTIGRESQTMNIGTSSSRNLQMRVVAV